MCSASYILCLFLFLSLAAGTEASGEDCWSLARLKYSGGGDWYSDPTGLPNLIARARKDLGKEICAEEATVSLMDGMLYQYPVLYMTGHGNVFFSEEEKTVLREYLYRGGLLFADDNYGMDSSFRAEMRSLFRDVSLRELPASHPVFSSFYKFSGAPPKVHLHDGKKPQLLGIDLMGRTVVIYAYESDLGDGWEDPEVHHVDPGLREKALRMGVNIIAWYLQGQKTDRSGLH